MKSEAGVLSLEPIVSADLQRRCDELLEMGRSTRAILALLAGAPADGQLAIVVASSGTDTVGKKQHTS